MTAGAATPLERSTLETMGTVVTFDLVPGSTSAEALGAARAAFLDADACFSLWRPGTPMDLVRRGELAPEDAPTDVAEVLALCEQARELTDGWFDHEALPGGCDPTGLVKGWAAQRAADRLTGAAGRGIVNAAGDIATAGAPSGDEPWRIGVSDPRSSVHLVAVVPVRGAIATSGTYARGAHLFDPRRRAFGAGFASATVTGPDLAIADAMATALCVAGPEGLGFIELAEGYAGFGVRRDGQIEATREFPFEPVPEALLRPGTRPG